MYQSAPRSVSPSRKDLYSSVTETFSAKSDTSSNSAPDIDEILAIESTLIEQIQSLQSKLAEHRYKNRTSGRARSRLSRSLSGIKLNALDSSLRNPGTAAPSVGSVPLPPVKPLRQRIISVSLRLPTKADRGSARQELFDSGMPSKGMFVLERISEYPFLWVGAVDPAVDEADFEDIYGAGVEPLGTSAWKSSGLGYPYQFTDDLTNNFFPVGLPDEQLDHYYQFCEETLWCLLHSDYDAINCDALEKQWAAYNAVNLRFAEALTEIYEEGDLIWIHNYHLMLLPAMLRKRLWSAKIGFFLYTPFPSAEIFRILPYRSELLRGVLGADLAGFYTYEYTKQFISSCARLLGLDCTPKAIKVDPREASVCRTGIYPAGIDFRALKTHTFSKSVRKRVGELKARFGKRRIIVCVDRLDDCFSGIALKLLAFEQFLTLNPMWSRKTVLIQVAMIPKESRSFPSYRSQANLVNEIVGRVNSTFGTMADSPIHYINAELEPDELYALMCIGHVCIVSTIRDGMGLVPYEWTVCQHNSNKGCLMLSEFAGAAHSFATALHLNPWNVDDLAKLILTALRMPKEECIKRNDAAYDYVTKHTARMWGLNFLEDLEEAERFSAISETPAASQLYRDEVIDSYRSVLTCSSDFSVDSSRALQQAPLFPSDHPSGCAIVNHGLLDGSGMPSSYSPLPAECHEQFNLLRSRRPKRSWKLFVFDYDGALIDFQAIPKLAMPPAPLLQLLERLLASSPDNVILIVSGRDRACLTKWFGDLPVYIAAEHGCFLRAPGDDWVALFRQEFSVVSSVSQLCKYDLSASASDSSSSQEGSSGAQPGPVSQVFPKSVDLKVGESCGEKNGVHQVAWKSHIMPVMKHFAERTPGALLEEGEATLTWHYNDAATDFGLWQARDLQKHLESFLLQHLSVEVLSGDERSRWLKVKPSGVDKAVAIERVIKLLRESYGKGFGSRNGEHSWGKASKGILAHYHGMEADNQSCISSGAWFQRRTEMQYVRSKRGRAICEMKRRRNSFHDFNSFVIIDGMEKKSFRQAVAMNRVRSEAGNVVDFIMCVGSDRSDERMYQFLRDERRLGKSGINMTTCKIITVKIGPGATGARYTLEGPEKLLEIIDEIAAIAEGTRMRNSQTRPSSSPTNFSE